MSFLKIYQLRGTDVPSNYFDNLPPEVTENLLSNSMSSYFCNTYLAQSSIENYKSVRFPDGGSPFIQMICKTFEEKWQTQGLVDIFTNDVAKSLQAWETHFGEVWNLTPEFRILGNSTIHQENTLHAMLQKAEAPLGNFPLYSP